MSGSPAVVLLTILAHADVLLLTTPGPNLVVALRVSLSGSFRATLAAALGIGCGAGLASVGALLAATALSCGAASAQPSQWGAWPELAIGSAFMVCALKAIWPLYFAAA
ncbi:hypothetical protein GXW71_34375 [Roseomonas hellenica]|uniref:Lysine transporter LysE n=1 Tax=Plastoroseomonas hellenica TaxID=2687306 RepID=A0ABS5FBH4_9PROT|nr:hypothetical protein [Plastoroseomonas hellenica]MBR0669480.1 hypothetical protein [Plastoroseomonas hellenica]